MESWRVCLTWLDSNYRRKTSANYVDHEEDENDDHDHDWSLYVWLYIFTYLLIPSNIACMDSE